MAKLLVVRKHAEASRARSFQELWKSLNNDQCADWRALYRRASKRDLDPDFSNARDDDWPAFAALIVTVKDIVLEINRCLHAANWSDAREINAMLERCASEDRLSEKNPAYRSVRSQMADEIVAYAMFGGRSPDVGKFRLFDIVDVPPPPALDESTYDIFVSYKTKRYALQAERMATHLGTRGYRFWFDRLILTRKEGDPELFETEYLLSLLVNGVRRSRCALIFEAAQRAVVLPPGRTEEQSIADRTAMIGPDGALITWDWQIIEIMAAERGLAIHPTVVAVFDKQAGPETELIPYGGDDQLVAAIHAGLQSLGVAPSRGA